MEPKGSVQFAARLAAPSPADTQRDSDWASPVTRLIDMMGVTRQLLYSVTGESCRICVSVTEETDMRLKTSKWRELGKRIVSVLLNAKTWRLAALILRVVDHVARIIDR